MTKEAEKIEQVIIETCIKIGKRRAGSLIVLGGARYKPMIDQKIIPFNIVENPKTFESLCLIDGAVIVKLDGTLEAYGVQLQAGNIIMRNFGTRHSSALNASMTMKNTIFVVSEEDQKVRIFKEGKMIMEIDSLTRGVEKKITEIHKLLESVMIGIGTASVIGAGLLAPVVGITVISGITVFVAATGVSYFVKKIIEWGLLKK